MHQALGCASQPAQHLVAPRSTRRGVAHGGLDDRPAAPTRLPERPRPCRSSPGGSEGPTLIHNSRAAWHLQLAGGASRPPFCAFVAHSRPRTASAATGTRGVAFPCRTASTRHCSARVTRTALPPVRASIRPVPTALEPSTRKTKRPSTRSSRCFQRSAERPESGSKAAGRPAIRVVPAGRARAVTAAVRRPVSSWSTVDPKNRSAQVDPRQAAGRSNPVARIPHSHSSFAQTLA